MFIYEEFGMLDKPILLFIHGGGVGGWMWDGQVDYFKEYHCIVPTLAGHSSRNDETAFSIEKSAVELIELIESIKGDRPVHLIGFSIGAQIGLTMVSLKPRLFETAVINSALIIPQKSLLPFITPTVKLSFPLIKNRTFARMQAKELHMEGEWFEKYYEETLKIKKETLCTVLQENMSFTLPISFSESTTKMLVTVGEKEKGIMQKSADQITSANQNCCKLVIPCIGHGLPTALPSMFNKIVALWIEEQRILDEEAIQNELL